MFFNSRPPFPSSSAHYSRDIEKCQKPINAEIHQRSIKSKQELQVTDPQQINSDRSGSEHATLEGLVLCGARTRQRQRAATVC